jgi:hypothetical protein
MTFFVFKNDTSPVPSFQGNIKLLKNMRRLSLGNSLTKNHVGRHCDFTVKNLIKQLDSEFNKVTAKTCEKIIAKVRSVEDEFWTTDIKMDAQ